VGSVDAFTVAAVPVSLLVVVGVAAYGPVVRAAKVDARTAFAAE